MERSEKEEFSSLDDKNEEKKVIEEIEKKENNYIEEEKNILKTQENIEEVEKDEKKREEIHEETLDIQKSQEDWDEEDEDEEDEEEEDEEDDEEEEDDDTSDKRPKKRRKERRNQFLDVEAEVEEDEEEEDEDEDFEREEDFIAEEIEELDVDHALQGDDRQHRDLDRQLQKIEDADAERLAKEYREKYGRSSMRFYRGDIEIAPQRLLLPSVNDPNLWAVRCKPGREKHIIYKLMRKTINLQHSEAPLEIISAFQRDGLNGYIYVEAKKQAHIVHACKDIVNVYTSRIVLVPIKEMPDLLKIKKQILELVPGAYVRIKRGKYAGDLAQVDNLSENGLSARVKIVPRLDYSTKDSIYGTDDKKRHHNGLSINSRPPQRFFNEKEVAKLSGNKSFTKRGTRSYIFNNDEYQDGYLMKDIKLTGLITEDVNPTLEEITKFNSGVDNNDNFDLSSLAQSIKTSNITPSFQPGDHVEVLEGEQSGVHGVVEAINNGIITLYSEHEGLKGEKIEIPSKGLKKRFKQGDNIRVTNGKYKGNKGIIICVKDDQVVLLSDFSMTEITVFSKDISEATQPTGTNVVSTEYNLHDLVQLDTNTIACITKIDGNLLRILDQNGLSRTILPNQISMKHQSKNSVATDKNGLEIHIGDTVKDLDDKNKQWNVIHIIHEYAFLYDRGVTENNGVFVTKTKNLSIITAKGSRIPSSTPDLNKMNPALQRPAINLSQTVPRFIGKDKAVGETVNIRLGPYKGLLGIVKDTTETSARVELHTYEKTITIEKSKLAFKNRYTGKMMSYFEFVTSKGGYQHNRPNIRNTTEFDQPKPNIPIWAQTSGNKAPLWINPSSRTPAWSNGGLQTPAWSNTGSRTPVWSNALPQTPAYAGSKTPAISGSATPGYETSVWNTGSKTPGYSSMTPAYIGSNIRWTEEDTKRLGLTSLTAPWENISHINTPGLNLNTSEKAPINILETSTYVSKDYSTSVSTENNIKKDSSSIYTSKTHEEFEPASPAYAPPSP